MTDRRTFLAGLLGGAAMGAAPAAAVPLPSGDSIAGTPALLLLECHIAGTGYADIPDSVAARSIADPSHRERERCPSRPMCVWPSIASGAAVECIA